MWRAGGHSDSDRDSRFLGDRRGIDTGSVWRQVSPLSRWLDVNVQLERGPEPPCNQNKSEMTSVMAQTNDGWSHEEQNTARCRESEAGRTERQCLQYETQANFSV